MSFVVFVHIRFFIKHIFTQYDIYKNEYLTLSVKTKQNTYIGLYGYLLLAKTMCLDNCYIDDPYYLYRLHRYADFAPIKPRKKKVEKVKVQFD